jgi:hypothetical protein
VDYYSTCQVHCVAAAVTLRWCPDERGRRRARAWARADPASARLSSPTAVTYGE